LGKDRQTIVRALRGVEPDGVEMKQPRYKLATIMKAETIDLALHVVSKGDRLRDITQNGQFL
jgi:hypothetical protein